MTPPFNDRVGGYRCSITDRLLTKRLTLLFVLQTVLIKQCEKLEVTVHELTIKIEEINRTVIDLTSIKTRLSQVRCTSSSSILLTQRHAVILLLDAGCHISYDDWAYNIELALLV